MSFGEVSLRVGVQLDVHQVDAFMPLHGVHRRQSATCIMHHDRPPSDPLFYFSHSHVWYADESASTFHGT